MEILPETIRPIQRAEYERMVEIGLFEDERVELLEGFLISMSPIGPDHDEIVTRLNERFVQALGKHARVRPQCTFVTESSAPQPDLAVVAPRDYRSGHPDDAYLVVEVARSSLKKDRGVKARVYARAGVAEYWVVNLVDSQVEAFREPGAKGYGRVDIYRSGDRIECEARPEILLDVTELFA